MGHNRKSEAALLTSHVNGSQTGCIPGISIRSEVMFTTMIIKVKTTMNAKTGPKRVPLVPGFPPDVPDVPPSVPIRPTCPTAHVRRMADKIAR